MECKRASVIHVHTSLPFYYILQGQQSIVKKSWVPRAKLLNKNLVSARRHIAWAKTFFKVIVDRTYIIGAVTKTVQSKGPTHVPMIKVGSLVTEYCDY